MPSPIESTIKGLSIEKLFQELDLESLQRRR